MMSDLRVINKGFTWQLSHNQHVGGCGWSLPGYFEVCILDPALEIFFVDGGVGSNPDISGRREFFILRPV